VDGGVLLRDAASADTKHSVLQEELRCSGEIGFEARGAALLFGDAHGSARLGGCRVGEVKERAYQGLTSSSEWRRFRSNRATRGAAAPHVSCSAKAPACCACPLVEESFTFRSPLACLPLVVLA
jgi:hypothetical protein